MQDINEASVRKGQKAHWWSQAALILEKNVALRILMLLGSPLIRLIWKRTSEDLWHEASLQTG